MLKAVLLQGLLLPLCQSGTCTLREAVIFSSVINRVSIPVVHSAAALLRLAEMPYAGTTSFFIRVLLDKKYALPYRVVRLRLSSSSTAATRTSVCLPWHANSLPTNSLWFPARENSPIAAWLMGCVHFSQVDAVVDHFMRFQQEERTLPVVWHQSLLVFVQRYGAPPCFSGHPLYKLPDESPSRPTPLSFQISRRVKHMYSGCCMAMMTIIRAADHL